MSGVRKRARRSAQVLAQPVAGGVVSVGIVAVAAGGAGQTVERVVGEVLAVRSCNSVDDGTDVVRRVIGVSQVLDSAGAVVSQVGQAVVEVEAARLRYTVAERECVDWPEGLITDTGHNRKRRASVRRV